jgi:hypothetical protein
MPKEIKSSAQRRLVLLADGGALLDLNDRLASEGAPKKDFARIPDSVVKGFADERIVVDCPVESRVLCTVGSERAQSFLAKMEQDWTVRAFPLSFAKYERPGDSDVDKHKFRLRFHAYLGYVLGVLTGSTQDATGLVIGLLSDDAHLLPCLADAKAAGIDARLIWWQAALPEEVAYLAARNGVPLLLLPHDEMAVHYSHHRDIAIERLLRGTPRS